MKIKYNSIRCLRLLNARTQVYADAAKIPENKPAKEEHS